jgi:hypothetical protein
LISIKKSHNFIITHTSKVEKFYFILLAFSLSFNTNVRKCLLIAFYSKIFSTLKISILKENTLTGVRLPFFPFCNTNTHSYSFGPFLLVSRLVGRSENYEMDLTLDFNSEIYPLRLGEKFSLVLASSLSLDGVGAGGVEKRESWRERAPGERDLSDEYEYVMFGKVYRYEDANKGSSGQQV